MNTNHTPGPWETNQSELEACSPLCEIRGKGGAYVITRDVGYQNARLIAQAPALLAALEGLEIVYAEYMALRPDPNSDACALVMKLVQNARTVIAQAKGETR